MGVEPIIDESYPSDLLFLPEVDGQPMGRGGVPRDSTKYPTEMFDAPSQIVLIPKSEWSARIKESEERKTRVSDILRTAKIPSLNQQSDGYCWGYSVTGTVQAVRAIANQPYVPLSAHMVCAVIKNGRNEGGWCGLSAKFIRENGVCSQALWPQGSRNLSLYTAECKADAAKHKITEDYVDLTRSIYDQNLTFEQLATCLLLGIPCATDFNWWSHSVMACDLVEVEPGDFGIRIRNSWSDSWGDLGFGILRGNRCIPDGALATRVAA